MAYVFLTSPIRQKLQEFRIFLEKCEYRENTIIHYRTHVSKFLRSHYNSKKETDLKDKIDEFLQNESERAPQAFKDCRAALYAYFKSLMNTSYPKEDTINEKEIEKLLDGFRGFQKNVKCLSDTTVAAEANQVGAFLNFIYRQSPGSFNVSNINALDIRNYFVEEAVHLKPSSKGKVATSIRNFFRYLHFSHATIDESIFKIPLSPAIWKMSNVPTVLSNTELESLLNCFDKNHPSGIRDYAIVLCFLELGLRCIEVAGLTMDDFDWENSIINIRNTKTHIDRALPIPSALGEAVVNYLQSARPISKNRTLFIRFSHTRGEPMGREQIRGAMRRAYKRAGFSETITGTHILRRTVATKIFKKGFPLKMVADILGHKSLESTAIYTKVETEMLVHAANIWPGGGSLC